MEKDNEPEEEHISIDFDYIYMMMRIEFLIPDSDIDLYIPTRR